MHSSRALKVEFKLGATSALLRELFRRTVKPAGQQARYMHAASYVLVNRAITPKVIAMLDGGQHALKLRYQKYGIMDSAASVWSDRTTGLSRQA